MISYLNLGAIDIPAIEMAAQLTQSNAAAGLQRPMMEVGLVSAAFSWLKIKNAYGVMNHA